MEIDIKGRIRNVSLPISKPLLPLFEAIVNSIQAIDDLNIPNGRIDVTVIRDTDHLFSDEDRTMGDIIGFEISDNGIGFTDSNYDAFKTSDTTYKASRGGKGVGRFLWLVAFDDVEIESHYRHEGEGYVRKFRFVPEGDGIDQLSKTKSDIKDNWTLIKLNRFKEQYRKQCPKKTDTIGSYVVEYCLEYFIGPNCPSINLFDRASGDSFDLNALFEKEMVASSKHAQFRICGTLFEILNVRLYSTHIHEHNIHYCADHRVVKSEKLFGKIPNLARQLEDEKGRRFVYAGYLESNFLNSNVNAERTNFAIASNKLELLGENLTWTDIQKAAIEQCASYMDPYTRPIREMKNARIESFVAKEAPMYRSILKYIPDKLEMIDPEINEEKLELELYEGYSKLQVSLKAEGQKLLQEEQKEDEDFEEYDKRLKDYFEKVSDINAADLARYVCNRKAILEFLQKQLAINKDYGKYQKEDRVHNIIFPMGKTSADVQPDGQNLWLIDEKLVFHSFLASDKQLRTMAPLSTNSQKEPDLIVFENAYAFAPSDDPPFSAVVIIEFKRPMRDDYTEGDNPLVQMRKLITDIIDGKARTPEGRDVPFKSGTPFYCYAVCDIVPSLEKIAKDFELMKAPDGQGFFGFKRDYNAYFEIISFSKMISDAKKRNAVLFNKLGLPLR